ncbi:hypothetical protein CFC21_075307 [Triticum aestivum]|uniref:NB-ARC domain-containing protein n=2 Tax=Triticum aestivum TaxID=4565 RepID=A0A3B6LXV5_WHEAT|nr:uncharacterized protein LOC123114511 [Triticum aestivum]KAF7069720.1 hypothetical protein CFC21_075307 [Triticum aestivum]
MAAALGVAATLLGKVFTMPSAAPVAAYVDNLELGHNSQQIRAKLAHTRGLLHNAQAQVSHNPGLQELLAALSRNADQAKNLLDELHYFQIHDKLHGTTYANTQEAGPDLKGVVRHQALHAGSALRHTLGSLVQCFSCSPTPKSDDAVAPRRVTNTLGSLLQCFSCSCTPKSKRNGGDDAAAAVTGVGGDAAAAVAGVNNSNSASADDGSDTLHFDRVFMSREIKSVLEGMQSHCDLVSNLLATIPSNSTAVVVPHRPRTVSMTFEGIVNRITDTGATHTVSVLPIVGPGGIGKTTFTTHLYNDARTKKHFDVQVWVCVSTDFDVLKLTREILACIPAPGEGGSSGVANETTNLDHLQRSILRCIKSKRFLIVLDDIWKCDSQDQWKTLLAPFTKGEAKGSMVLVTTRFPKVADMMEIVDPLELRGLESNVFFTFFEACIFGEDDKPEHYQDEFASIA